MSVVDKILICIFLFAIIVWQALHQAHLFKQNKTISHFWKGLAYAGAVVLVTIPYIMTYDWWCILKIPLIGILIRAAFFYIILNKARGYIWYYNGSLTINPAQDMSLIDQWENRLPLKWLKVLKICYVIIFITTIIVIK